VAGFLVLFDRKLNELEFDRQNFDQEGKENSEKPLHDLLLPSLEELHILHPKGLEEFLLVLGKLDESIQTGLCTTSSMGPQFGQLKRLILEAPFGGQRNQDDLFQSHAGEIIRSFGIKISTIDVADEYRYQ